MKKKSGPAALDAWLTSRGAGSAAALAQSLDVSASTVSRWRRGHVAPSYGARVLLHGATDGAVPTSAAWEVQP